MKHLFYGIAPLLFASVFTLSGCLPTEEQKPANNQSDPESSSTSDQDDPVSADTRLASISNSQGLELSPFQTSVITFNAPLSYANESRLFLKVVSDKATLFMGEVVMTELESALAVAIPITLPATEGILQYEVFGNSGQNPIYFGEVAL